MYTTSHPKRLPIEATASRSLVSARHLYRKWSSVILYPWRWAHEAVTVESNPPLHTINAFGSWSIDMKGTSVILTEISVALRMIPE